MTAKLFLIGKEIEGQAKLLTSPGFSGPPNPPGEPAKGRSGALQSEYRTNTMNPLHVRVSGGQHALWTELGTGLWHHEPTGEDFELTLAERPRLVPKPPHTRLVFQTWEGTWHRLESVAGQQPRSVLRPSVQLSRRKALEILSKEVTLT